LQDGDCNVTWKLDSRQQIYNTVENEYRCLNGAELVSQLEETRKELIIMLLYKEINDITTEKTFKPSDTTLQYEAYIDSTSSSKWAGRRPYKELKARNSKRYQ
jgi:hypothetical protein